MSTQYCKIFITSWILLAISGCCGGILHYSKFKYYSIIKTYGTNEHENKQSKQLEVSISERAYSQRWRNRYYVVINFNFHNMGSDTEIVNKNIITLKINSDSFFVRDDYAPIDETGKEHYFKLTKLPQIYVIPPKSIFLIPFQFDSYKHYSEKAYQDLFTNDTIKVLVNNEIKFKLFAKSKG